MLEVNDDWADNSFVVKANLMHENVHDGKHKFSTPTVISRSSVAVYNDEEKYDIFGITDCLEFIKKSGGIHINGLTGEYSVKIIEYKPRQPKDGSFNESDAIQVFAQKLCVDYIWNCNSEGYLYYADTKKRVKLPFNEQFEDYNSQLIEYLIQMRKILRTGEIPDKRKGQKCGGCSLEDYCFSKAVDFSVKKNIIKMDTLEEI